MSTWNNFWVKGSWCVWLTNLLHFCADYLEIWKVNFLEYAGPIQACYRECFTFGTCPWLFQGLLYLQKLSRPVTGTALHSGMLRDCFTFKTCPGLLQGLLYLQDLSKPLTGTALSSGPVQACYNDCFTFRTCPGLLQWLLYIYLNIRWFPAILLRYLQGLIFFVYMKKISVFRFSLKYVKLYGTKYLEAH